MRSLCIILSLLTVFILTAIAEVPRVINYQGVLLGVEEQPVPEKNYKITFRIYDEAGALFWEEEHSQVFISGGQFQVILGSKNPLGIPFDQPYFLGIQVENDSELEPRMMLTSAAYAIRAEDADKLLGHTLATSPQPNALIPLDSNGKFPASVISGGGATGDYIQKNTPDTSRATSTSPLLVISNQGTGDGINARSQDGRGLEGRSENHHGVVGWTGTSDRSGVFGHSENGNGVAGRSENKYGVLGSSVNSFGGFFRSDFDHYDLALGGPVGRINTDPDVPNSILYLSSNHDILMKLDNDGGESSMLKILNSGGNNICTFDEAGNMALYNNGSKTIELGTGLDYAEGFNVSTKAEISAGTVLIIDDEHPGKLKTSYIPYDTRVAGIAAGANGLGSGVRLGSDEFDLDVALAGRVYCNVDASFGQVKPGDLLTTSPTPGYAMVVNNHEKAIGAILGKAMQSLNTGERGKILVLVTLQ